MDEKYPLRIGDGPVFAWSKQREPVFVEVKNKESGREKKRKFERHAD